MENLNLLFNWFFKKMLCLMWLDSRSESDIFLHSESQLITHNHYAFKDKKVDSSIKIPPEVIC